MYIVHLVHKIGYFIHKSLSLRSYNNKRVHNYMRCTYARDNTSKSKPG